MIDKWGGYDISWRKMLILGRRVFLSKRSCFCGCIAKKAERRRVFF